MGKDLYLLPLQIIPCKHIGTFYLRNLNSTIAPLKHPFGNVFNIESYNTAWFDDKSPSRPPEFLRDNFLPYIIICGAKPLSKHHTSYPLLDSMPRSVSNTIPISQLTSNTVPPSRHIFSSPPSP